MSNYSIEKKEHHIIKVLYVIHSHILLMEESEPVIKETNCFYKTKRHQYRKEDLGKAQLKSGTSYPYVDVAILDGTEEDARRLLKDWFENIGNLILDMQIVDTSGFSL